MASVKRIEELQGSEERAREAQAFIRQGRAVLAEARKLRDAAVLALLAEGWTQYRVQRETGVPQAVVSRTMTNAARAAGTL